MNTLLAFDTSYLYFRAFFGVPDSFHSPDGRPVNAVRGTLDFISRLIKHYSPTSLACAWDDDWRPQWRVDLVPSYKTHRVAEGDAEEVDDALSVQVPLIREVLDAAGIPVIGAPGYEADDVLASLAHRHDGPTFVVTGDRDLFQLVDENTSIVYVARSVAKHELVTPAVLTEKYGVPANRYVDFAVLRGDPSDGLPGVKGIGEKTAANLTASYPTLEAMVEAARDSTLSMPKGMRTKLLADAGYLSKAREVVTCVNTLPLPPLSLRPVDGDAVARLTADLGLGNSLTRLIQALAETETDATILERGRH